MRLAARLRKLERLAGDSVVVPYVVFRKADEPLEEACRRALDGQKPPAVWRFILAEDPLAVDQWIAAYSPNADVPTVPNPSTSG